MKPQEINPQETTRAEAFELWMNAPNYLEQKVWIICCKWLFQESDHQILQVLCNHLH